MMQYISYRKSERLSPHTVYNQEVLLNRFLNFLSSKKVTSIKAINESHIIKYLSVIGVKYKSVASISTYILRQFFRHKKGIRSYIPQLPPVKNTFIPYIFSMKTNGLLEIVLAVNVMERGREWENLRTRTLVKWICMCVCLSICIPRMEITLLLVSSFAPRN